MGCSGGDDSGGAERRPKNLAGLVCGAAPAKGTRFLCRRPENMQIGNNRLGRRAGADRFPRTSAPRWVRLAVDMICHQEGKRPAAPGGQRGQPETVPKFRSWRRSAEERLWQLESLASLAAPRAWLKCHGITCGVCGRSGLGGGVETAGKAGRTIDFRGRRRLAYKTWAILVCFRRPQWGQPDPALAGWARFGACGRKCSSAKNPRGGHAELVCLFFLFAAHRQPEKLDAAFRSASTGVTQSKGRKNHRRPDARETNCADAYSGPRGSSRLGG